MTDFIIYILKVNDEGSLSEIVQYGPLNVFSASKGSDIYMHILFVVTIAGVLPRGGPKKSPRTSSIVLVIFSFEPLR